MRTLRRGVPHAEVSRPSSAQRLRAVDFSAASGRSHQTGRTARVPGLEQVQSTTLANGMKVIVWTDRDIPNVALYNWVRVGSRNEVPGITGLAHFFEHMMFNGTAKRTPGEFDRLMEAQGGSNNAFTSDERHRLPGLDPAHGARPGVRPGSRPARESVLRPEGDRERTRRRLFGAAPARRRQQRGLPRRAGAGHGVRRASVPDSHRRLAGRHPGLEDRRPAEVLQDELRA